MVELLATIVIMTILMAMTIGALSYYWASRSLDTGAREVLTQIREAQALALATGNTHRIDFSGTGTYTVQRWDGSSWVNVRAAKSLPGGISISAAPAASFGGDQYIEFLARGVGEDGQLVLNNRYGKTKTIQVEGESVNVTVS